MPIIVRITLGVVVGMVVTLVLAYAGAIVLLLASIGIPLGAEAHKTTAGEYAWLLLIAGVAAIVGGRVAARLARRHVNAAVIALSLVLAAGGFWAFTRPGSQWPSWWSSALAVVVAAGTCVGGLVWPRALGRRPEN